MALPEAEANLVGVRDGSRTQRLLLTLHGDYWLGQTVYIPSSALVALLAEFGVSQHAARAALSRVARRGLLEGSKQGRHTSYRLRAGAVAQWIAIRQATMRFTALTPETAPRWDGRWTIAAYSLPAEQADERRRIRLRLRSLGFGPVHDALWVTPHRRAAEAVAALDELGAVSFTVLEDAATAPGSTIDPHAVWPLDAVADRYRALIVELTATSRRLRDRNSSPSWALVARTEAMNAWRRLPALDPVLPAELLPDGWPGWQARTLFAEVYDGLGEPAEQRVRELVRPYSAEAADAVRHITVGSPDRKGRPLRG